MKKFNKVIHDLNITMAIFFLLIVIYSCSISFKFGLSLALVVIATNIKERLDR